MNKALKCQKITLFLLYGVLFCGCGEEIPLDQKPNILILQADDLGWDDLPLNNNEFVQTPGIDKLADESVQISRFYVNPVCAPTRASLLTGRDFLMTGVSHVHGGKDFINLDETIIAEVFKDENYATGMWGKWHSGKTEGYFPWQRGFDEAYMAQLYKHENSRGIFNGKYVEHEKWTDEVIVDYAIDFVNKNRDKNFFAYLSFLTCHAPLVAKENIVKKYEDRGLSENLSKLYAMIEQMDKEILRLLNELDDLKLRKETIILFMSDNGPAIINKWLSEEDRDIRYMSNYKGHKGNIWENGVKSPLLFSYKGEFIPSQIDMLCDVTDIFPTLAEIAGIDLLKYNLNLTGRSFAKNLISKNYERPDKIVFNYADHGWPPTDRVWSPRGIEKEYSPLANNMKLLDYENQIISITSDNFKLLKNPSPREGDILNDEKYVLIEIKKDAYESINISSEKPEVFDAMKTALMKRFNKIADSKNAYTSPVFLLYEDKLNVVPLYAPNNLSGNLKNAAFYSYPWNEAGSYAEFKYNSKDDFVAQPLIKKIGDSEEIKYTISIDGITVDSRSNKNEEIVFEDIFVTAGEGIIKVAVESSNSGKEIQFHELRLVNIWTKL